MSDRKAVPFKRKLRSWLRYPLFLLRGEPPVYFEEIDEKFLKRCVAKENPVILEIGANDGRHTEWFLSVFPGAQLYCFEPDPRAYAKFKARLGENPAVQLFDVAVCDREGTTILFQSGGAYKPEENPDIQGDWDASSSIRKPKEHLTIYPDIKFDQQVEVKTTTLDAFFRDKPELNIDFIWMDVQGAEIDVLRGGPELLKRTRLVYMEYNRRELYEGQATLKDLLEQLKNFRVVRRFPGDILLRNKSLS